jgi:hypothetical protein
MDFSQLLHELVIIITLGENRLGSLCALGPAPGGVTLLTH